MKISTVSLLLTISSLLHTTTSFSLFSSTPSSNIYLGNQTATVSKISSDQSLIMVGFQNGSLQSYNSNGQLFAIYSGHNSSILDIEWIPNYGPISLDASGKVILYRPNGTQVTTMTLNSSSMTEMTVTFSNNGTNYVGFNFGSMMQ